MIEQQTKEAASAYAQIVKRYPMMDRMDDAKRRLAALHQPIPRPTKADVARNKAELASRSEASTLQHLMGVVKKSPDVAQATKVGDPSLADPMPVSAPDITKKTLTAAMEAARPGNTVAVQTLNGGTPAANEATPRSDSPAPTPDAAVPAGSPFAQPAVAAPAVADPNELKPTAPDPNELKPTAAPDPNELKPATDAQAADPNALPPPPQVNEIQQGDSSSSKSASATSSSEEASDADMSSSKKKKKKGLKRIIP